MPKKRQYTGEEIQKAQEALTAAVEAGDTTQVKQAIKDYGNRIDPNAKDKDGLTTLGWAAGKGHTDIVETLIKADQERKFKERINADTIQGALYRAAWKGHTDIVNAFIGAYGNRIDPNAKYKYGLTALSRAATQGHTDIVEALIEGFDKQIDPNARDWFGSTALSWAVVFSRTKMAKVLIEADQEGKFAEGIDLNAKDKDGQTVFDYAEEKGNDEMIEILEDFKREKRKQKWAALFKQFKSCFGCKDQDKKPDNTNNDGLKQLKL